MKYELSAKIVKPYLRLRAKTFSYLTDNYNKEKKRKRYRKCVVKRKHKFEDYKNCLEAAQIEYKIKH